MKRRNGIFPAGDGAGSVTERDSALIENVAEEQKTILAFLNIFETEFSGILLLDRSCAGRQQIVLDFESAGEKIGNDDVLHRTGSFQRPAHRDQFSVFCFGDDLPFFIQIDF